MTKKEEEEEEEEVEEPEDFGLYTEKARIKRESKNSNKYRKYYTNLLKEHQGVLQEAWEGATTTTATTAATNASHNDDETLSRSQESKLIQDMWESERNAIGMGVLCGLAFFGVVRRLPRFLIRHVGGEHKIREVQKADEAAKESGTYVYQRAFAWLVEGTFSLWVANRVFHYKSQNSNGAYNTIAKIPLVSGRSIISDSICNPWIDITANQIPRSFWKNLDPQSKEIGAGITDERAWRSILEFSQNCVKRQAFERQLKSDHGLQSGDPSPISLPTNVPDNVTLSKAEAEQLVSDRIS